MAGEKGPASDPLRGPSIQVAAMDKGVILITGATASGKSGLALELAEALAQTGGATVINADSMQVYEELRVLTARPGAAELARAPHRLYGVVPAAERCSAGRWQGLARTEIRAAQAAGRVAIVVGGSGLYLRALLDGLAPVPKIPAAIRAAAQARHRELGGAGLRAELLARDGAAAGLQAGDSARLIRAWEVLQATGRPLSAWQAEQRQAPERGLGDPLLRCILELPRPELYRRCDVRFLDMIEAGALAEVAALEELALDPGLPAMKALGVGPLARHRAGQLSLDEAVALAQRDTRRYAKRQLTWLRHQAADWPTVTAQDSKRFFAKNFPIICQL